MPASAHWDDAPSVRFDVGPIGADWDLLGEAAGSQDVGLRRIRVSAGKQSTPLHAHQGEEELFFVLRGSGVSVQESGAFAIGEQDVVLHPKEGPAHTIVAGEEGCDVLAFGDRVRSESVRFPRIDAASVGGMVMDFHQVHQFQLEADRAGPVEVPQTLAERPGTIAGLAAVEAMTMQREGIDAQVRILGRRLGARHSALNHTVLAPGSESSPPHCHSAVEEMFVVLDGGGTLLLGTEEEQHELRAGSIVSRPAGSGAAHCFRAGEQGMTLLAYSNLDPSDMCFYPRSGKVSIRGLGVIFRPERVGYWDE